MNFLIKPTLAALALVGLMTPMTSADTTYTDWAAHALGLQEHLDDDRPLSQTFWVGTHNSYAAYNWDGSYHDDPNQTLSPTEQLDAGVRFIVYDVHPLNIWSDKMYLCHGAEVLGISWNCSSGNKRFKEGLKAVRDWINNGHSDSVVIIKLETETKLGKSADDIEDYIGSMIYRPADAGLSDCASLPVGSLTKQDVLDAGKNVIMIATPEKCGDMSSNKFRSRVFVGLDLYDDVTGLTDENEKFDRPNVAECEAYSAAYREANMLRQFDGATFLGILGGGDPKITADNLAGYMACGLNVFELWNYAGANRLTLDSGTHTTEYDFFGKEDMVWSWAQGEPNDMGSAEDCATSRADGRFNDAQCTNTERVACRSAAGHWQITLGEYFFSNGVMACESEFGSAYGFDKPATPYENAALLAAKSQVGASVVWINYSDQVTEGTWQ